MPVTLAQCQGFRDNWNHLCPQRKHSPVGQTHTCPDSYNIIQQHSDMEKYQVLGSLGWETWGLPGRGAAFLSPGSALPHNEWTSQGPPLPFLHPTPITISPWNRSLQPLTFLHFPSRLFLSAHAHPHILLSLNIHSSFLYQAVSKPDCIIFFQKNKGVWKNGP